MLKLVIFTLLSAILIIYLKSINSELSLLAVIGAGIVILFYTMDYLSLSVDLIKKMIEISGIDKQLYKIIFKMVSVGYLVEFGADIVNDFGLTSLANKLIFAGKVVIFSLSVPVIYAVFNLLLRIMQ